MSEPKKYPDVEEGDVIYSHPGPLLTPFEYNARTVKEYKQRTSNMTVGEMLSQIVKEVLVGEPAVDIMTAPLEIVPGHPEGPLPQTLVYDRYKAEHQRKLDEYRRKSKEQDDKLFEDRIKKPQMKEAGF